MLKIKLNLLYKQTNKITLAQNENNSCIILLDFHYECYAYCCLNSVYHKTWLKALIMDNLTINN